jgi:hypothetical protein
LGLDSETDHKRSATPFRIQNKLEKLNSAEINTVRPTYTPLHEFLSKTDWVAPFSDTKLLDKVSNEATNHIFKDLKSPNVSFLSADKITRTSGNIRLGRTSQQFETEANNIASVEKSVLSQNVSGTESGLVNSANINNTTLDLATRLLNTSFTFAAAHPPIASNNPLVSNYDFDKRERGENSATPTLLKSKEDVAPLYIFSSYWLSHYAHSNPAHRYENIFKRMNFFNQTYFPFMGNYAEYDFRN